MSVRLTSEYYKLVPKDRKANLIFRLKLLDWLNEGSEAERLEKREQVWRMCARDILFFVNVFGWLIEPREGVVHPFITFDFQDDVILKLVDRVECGKTRKRADTCQMKSRDMGATWCLLYVFFWYWNFHGLHSFLLLSSKQENVDARGNPKALFWKLEFILNGSNVPRMGLPKWMRPAFVRTENRLENLDNGSTIKGEATTANAGVSDRVTAIGLDEFTLMENAGAIWRGTRDVSYTRILNFTVRPECMTARELSENKELTQIRLHWTLHPWKAFGLYYDEKGKPRSPWYDEQVLSCANATEVATELDMEWTGTSGPYFDHDAIRACLQHAMFPRKHYAVWCVGDDWKDAQFVPSGEFAGKHRPILRVWPDMEQPYRDREYVIGVDVATGSGASNSVLSIWDCNGGEKVAELVTCDQNPVEFAYTAMAVGHWFRSQSGTPAKLKWELQGPGGIFGKEIVDQGYGNWYLRTDEEGLEQDVKLKPGWAATPNNKRRLLGTYAADLKNGRCRNPSKEGLTECFQYVYGPSGVPTHVRAANNEDPSGARAEHGDICIADALGWSECRAAIKNREAKLVTPVARPGSYQYIIEEHNRQRESRVATRYEWRRQRVA